MNDKTYLCSAIVSEIFSTLGRAFMNYRDEFDGCQYRDNSHLEDAIMNVIMRNHIISDPMYFPLIRELIGTVINEPALFAEWTSDDDRYFSEQLEFCYMEDEEFPFD